MATNSSHPQKVINCRGRACAKCGCCRDWYWTPNGKIKRYTKRPDATCASSYSYGISGYGPGCAGRCLHFLRCCFGTCTGFCIHPYYGGDGYGHGGGIPDLNGYLTDGLNNHILALSGVDLNARKNRNIAAGLASIVVSDTITSLASAAANDTDGDLNARFALRRAHHDDGHLCECSDNQQ
jgi:hypothetical protein